MDLYQKISILGPSAQYDTCGPRDFGETTNIPGVYHAKVAGNQVCRLFKVLQTNSCQNNCKYCAFRKDRDCSRTTATPDEMATAFESAYRRRLVDGLFLSSGIIKSANHTMTQMLDTVDILRNKLNYKGYVHLKLMPGTPNSCLDQALKIANRISLNIESPTEADLSKLSPDKDLKTGFFNTLFRLKSQINKAKLAHQKTPSLTTQFVVGAGTETDRDIVKMTNLLYQSFSFKRVFYSAFRPVSDTPFADKPAESLTRQHRLYQADFLLRFYRFSPAELFPQDIDQLSDQIDPKTAWAQNHPNFFPLNLNKANFWQLLRVPGLGPTTAKKIIKTRQSGKIHFLSQLSGQRVQADKIKKYIIF